MKADVVRDHSDLPHPAKSAMIWNSVPRSPPHGNHPSVGNRSPLTGNCKTALRWGAQGSHPHCTRTANESEEIKWTLDSVINGTETRILRKTETGRRFLATEFYLQSN